MPAGIVEVHPQRPCAVYARVSTEDQNVAQQAAYVCAWLRGHGREVVKVVQDEESGRLPLTERKDFLALLNESEQKHWDIGIVALDRLTRNWDDVTLIERHFRESWDHSQLLSASERIDLASASGRLTFRMLMAVGCHMPEHMREQQRVGIARARAEGKYKGGTRGRRWSK